MTNQIPVGPYRTLALQDSLLFLDRDLVGTGEIPEGMPVMYYCVPVRLFFLSFFLSFLNKLSGLFKD